MQCPTSRGSTKLAAENSEQRSTFWQRDKSNNGVGICLVAVMLVSTVAFIAECSDNCRFRQLFRPNSLFRTRHADIMLQHCFLPLVFVPIPVGLRCFRLSPGSARWMTPRRPVDGASAEQTVWSGLHHSHGLCLCASRVVSQRSTSGRQTRLSSWTLQQRLTKCSTHRKCCARAVQHGDPVFLAGTSCVTGFTNQLVWETSHTVADQASTILVSRGLDTTSVRSLGEPAQKSRSKP